jgi:hypothetical protein
MRMPSGTATSAASTNPPTTRQTVTPISARNPNRVMRIQPSCTMVIGSARNVLETNPPSVANAQAHTKRTKNEMPSAMRAPGLTGSRGRGMGQGTKAIRRPVGKARRHGASTMRRCGARRREGAARD